MMNANFVRANIEAYQQLILDIDADVIVVTVKDAIPGGQVKNTHAEVEPVQNGVADQQERQDDKPERFHDSTSLRAPENDTPG